MQKLESKIIDEFLKLKYSGKSLELNRILSESVNIQKELTKNGKDKERMRMFMKLLKLFCEEQEKLVAFVLEYIKK